MTTGEDKTLSDIAITGILGCVLAAGFNAVQQLRNVPPDKTINPIKFSVGIISAGAVGCIAAWILDDMGVSSQFSAAIISIVGYVGGPILDRCYDLILQELDAALKCLAKWVESEENWKR